MHTSIPRNAYEYTKKCIRIYQAMHTTIYQDMRTKIPRNAYRDTKTCIPRYRIPMRTNRPMTEQAARTAQTDGMGNADGEVRLCYIIADDTVMLDMV